jgi:two-component system, OmpR family, sensor kinase
LNKLGLRRRLFVIVLAAVAAGIAAAFAAFNLILATTLDHDARDLARTRATAQLALLGERHGHLTVLETPDDEAAGPYLWVFSRGRTLERPDVDRQLDRNALALAHRNSTGHQNAAGADILLYAVPAKIGGRRLGTVVAGVSVAPYEQTRKQTLIASLLVGGAILAIVAVAVSWLLRSSLRPVRTMTRQAADWSEHDIDHRFALGPPHDELTELASTLDGLLERIASSLRRERRLAAELSHELRTPLARIVAEVDLALRRKRQPAEYRTALEQVERNAAQLTRLVDALLAAARHEAGFESGVADAYLIANEAVHACSALASERGIVIDVQQPTAPIEVGVDSDLGERILQPLIENACRYGRSRVTIGVTTDDGHVRYLIADDGPGVTPHEAERIFEPGIRGTAGATMPLEGGAGLGLSLARRLARSVQGTITAHPDGHGHFELALPRA